MENFKTFRLNRTVVKPIYTLILLLIHTFFMVSTGYGQNLQRDSIQTILEEAYYRDQAPRLIIDSLMRSGISDGNKYLPVIEQQEQADSMNLAIVPPIIDMIHKSQMYDLDSTAYKACWIVIQHAPDVIMHKYEDFIKQLVERKLISVYSYMAYIDRCKVRQSKAQIYGWQFKRLSNGVTIQFPILTGVEAKWKELGIEYEESTLIPDEYNAQYMSKRCIDDTQFVVLGIISSNDPNLTDNVSISINGIEITSKAPHNFFETIVRKQELPIIVKVATQSNSEEYVIKRNSETDYIFLNCFVDGKTIDIRNE